MRQQHKQQVIADRNDKDGANLHHDAVHQGGE